MATPKSKQHEASVDSKKLAKIRRSLSKTIDEFKETLLEKLTPVKEDVPIRETLLPDPVMVTMEKTVEVSFIAEQPFRPEVGAEEKHEMMEKPVEMIQRVTPVRIEEIHLPHFNTIHPDIEAVVENIVPLQRQSGRVRVFLTGVDNHVNSSVRVFFQKLGIETFNAHGERPRGEFIVEQFQLNSNQFDFAVVVLSPEAVICQKFQTLEQGFWVTRQETIFELGFLVGKLGKGRVAVFYEEGPTKFKRPTEYFDLLYTSFDKTGLWQKRLINQLYTHGLIKESALIGA